MKMFRIMTFDAAAQNETSPDCPRTRFHPLRQAGLDLLCCQSISHSTDGKENFCRWLSETLGLTYSSFAAGRHQSGPLPVGEKTARGLAMLTGTGVWVLNSGSFVVGDPEEEAIVQFALIRKNGASVLALNLHLAVSRQVQTRQLRDLFGQPLLKDTYGAVVLCADQSVALPLKEWQDLTARSNYSLNGHLLPAVGNGGLLCLFTARTEAVSVVTIRHAEPMPLADGTVSDILPGNTVAFEIQRTASEKRIRPFFPLSFREQWLGYKEHRAVA
jgi:endonuclease/exonuclease/phosphatase family metal-dependent hydrolase